MDLENQQLNGKLVRALPSLTLVVTSLVFAIHYFQFDILAPVTLIPPWVWLVPLISVIAMVWRTTSRGLLLLNIIVLTLFTYCFVEEFHSLTRFGTQKSLPVDEVGRFRVRVATLNCNGGSSKAVLEPMDYEPDIVLLQESPGLGRK